VSQASPVLRRGGPAFPVTAAPLLTGPVGASVKPRLCDDPKQWPASVRLVQDVGRVPHRRSLAMPAAVHRSPHEREPWNPAESVTPA
jgi:hypothetical protein